MTLPNFEDHKFEGLFKKDWHFSRMCTKGNRLSNYYSLSILYSLWLLHCLLLQNNVFSICLNNVFGKKGYGHYFPFLPFDKCTKDDNFDKKCRNLSCNLGFEGRTIFIKMHQYIKGGEVVYEWHFRFLMTKCFLNCTASSC